MNRASDSPIRVWLALLGAQIVTLLVYWQGLSGTFVFDDSNFLIANDAIKVVSPGFSDWVAAARSFPVDAHQGRWLGMLSFALNHYFTGMDPYWFKLTNLAIHILNGLLLFLALRALFRLDEACHGNGTKARTLDAGMYAASIAALWMVLPINVSGVLYISQRLESLSNTFVFLGLWWYLSARLSHWKGDSDAKNVWLALLVCTGLGVLVKESAALLPLYAAGVELTMTRGRDNRGQWCRPILTLYGCLLLMPLVAGVIWLGGWINGPSSYGRAFTIPERLMTESRVLVEYMKWILAPSLDSLSLHHDDIKISHGLLDPPSTLASFAMLGGLLAAALWQRFQRPLFALGVLWFFSGHLLTATVIPLMLAFEHRNYFPSAGLLLAAFSLLAIRRTRSRNGIVLIIVILLFAFYALTTSLRSAEWSSDLRLAASDAAKRPTSSAAQYEYARALLGSRLNGEAAPMQRKAIEVLEPMAANIEADAVHNQLLIVTSARLGMPIKDEWWDSLIAKLRSRQPTSMDGAALLALLECFDEKVCPQDIKHLGAAFAAATEHAGGYAPLLVAYGEFARDYLHDLNLAELEFRRAKKQSPTDAVARANLIALLISTGQLNDAQNELEELRSLNQFGSLDERIKALQELLDMKKPEVPGSRG